MSSPPFFENEKKAEREKKHVGGSVVSFSLTFPLPLAPTSPFLLSPLFRALLPRPPSHPHLFIILRK